MYVFIEFDEEKKRVWTNIWLEGKWLFDNIYVAPTCL